MTRAWTVRALTWIGTTAVGWLLAWWIGLFLTMVAYSVTFPLMKALEAAALGRIQSTIIGFLSGLGGGLFGGTVGALGQWYAGPPHTRRNPAWIPATMACYGLVLASSWAISWPDPFSGGWLAILVGAMAGSLASIGHLFAMRGSALRWQLWVAGSTVAWGTGLAATFLWAQRPFAGELVAGGMIGLITLGTLGIATRTKPNQGD